MTLGAAALICFVATAGAANADILYPSVGKPNVTTYEFTATATGDVIAYFAGSGAGYLEEVGMLVNGIDTGVRGLNDHTSHVGDSVNLGSVHAGDTLTFLDDVSSIKTTWYSNSALNGDGGNHVYSAPAAAGVTYAGSPAGVYVAFEDLRFPNSDFNYHDDTFVFTNTSVAGAPEPSTWAMMGLGFVGLGFAGFHGRRGATSAA